MWVQKSKEASADADGRVPMLTSLKILFITREPLKGKTRQHSIGDDLSVNPISTALSLCDILSREQLRAGECRR